MIINDKKYKINENLILKDFSGFMDTAIYLKDNETSTIFPFQNKNANNLHNMLFIDDSPDITEWGQLFNILNIRDEYQKAVFLINVMHNLSHRTGLIESLMQASGYNQNRLNEAEYIIKLDGFKKQMLIEKNIPVKLLRLCDTVNSDIMEQMFEVILSQQINSNTAKDILGMFIDLAESTQAKVLVEIKSLLSRSHKDRGGKLSEDIKSIIYSARFPEYKKILDSIGEKKSEIVGKFQVHYDQSLEKKEITLSRTIESSDDIDLFISELTNVKNIAILLEILQRLN